MKLRLNIGKDSPQKEEIWKGIVRKAQQDGDYSLDAVAKRNSSVRRMQTYWISAAAVLLLILGGLYLFIPSASQDKYVQGRDLESIFADSLSYSKLVLSTGDTIALDDSYETNDIAYLQGEDKVLDFRKLDSTVFRENIQFIETGRGKQVHFILSDGTKVWLNASSKIEFPASFESDMRVVQASGEIYFEVAHDKDRPFIVKTDDQQVKVLGTHFNVKQYRNDSEKSVTLLEGAVEVSSMNAKSQPFRLTPSQQYIQIDRGTPRIKRLANPETAIAWKEGTFYFEEADAKDIIKELERWYPVKIELKQYAQDKKISGRIKRSDSLSKVIEMLQFFDIQILVEKD